MKQINIFIVAGFIQMSSLSSSAQAADITYPGASLAPSPFGSVPSSLFPGSSPSGNTVTITGGSIGGEAYGGVVNGPGDVSGNTVTVTGSPTIGALYGGRSAGGLVGGNTVIFNSGTVNSSIIGGRSTSGGATGNSVTVNDGNILTVVRGGQSDGGGEASHNSVTVTGGTVGSNVEGGSSASGTAAGNTVLVTGGSFNFDIAGARAAGGGHALNNMVRIENLVTSRELLGGAVSGSGDARSNMLEVLNGATRGNAYGGFVATGNAVGNQLVIHGGTVNLSAHGGAASGGGTAGGNTVVLYGGTVNGNVYGGRVNSGSGGAGANTAVVSGGSVLGSVYGGQQRGTGPSSGNLAHISGGSVGTNVYGGYSEGGPADGNAVEFSGGAVAAKVYGGAGNGAAGATGNRVTISGGHFGNDIHGGFSAGGQATGNTVELSGTPDISAATIYGGLSGGGGDVFSGNTFNVDGFRGPAKGILNFETYNFTTPALGNGETQITITGGTPTGMDGTTVNLRGMAGGAPYLRPGDSIVLIDKVTGIPASANGGQVPKGIALLYDFDITTTDGALRATLRGRDVNPDVNVLPGGPAAAAAFMGHYADLLTGLASEKLLEPAERKAGPTVYAVSTGGKYRYTNGPSLDVRGVSFITGLDWRLPTESADTVLGVFFEGGFGDYDTRYGAGRSGAVKGDGNVNYHGAGVLGFVGLPSGPYAEASLRGGQVRTDFSSTYTRDFLGRDADYETSHAYYGAHGGLGLLWRPSERSVLDIYGKYLWLRQTSDDVDILGDNAHFKAIDSQRVRTGARFSHTLEKGFTPYAGVAYEYEFDGKARADVGGIALTGSSLQGGSVVGELGGVYKNPNGLFLELGVRGFEGTREGFAGRLQVGFEF